MSITVGQCAFPKGTMFPSQNWKFTAPVYIGDAITVEAEVVSVRPSKLVTERHVQIRRSDGTTVLEGEACASRLRSNFTAQRGTT
jgi:3-hydroxybutyryl-CoA dehydratase